MAQRLPWHAVSGSPPAIALIDVVSLHTRRCCSSCQRRPLHTKLAALHLLQGVERCSVTAHRPSWPNMAASWRRAILCGRPPHAVSPAHSTVRPRCRGLHSLTKTAAGRLVLFAGAPNSGPMLGDLWALDPASGAWAELDPDGQARRSRPSFGPRPA